MASLTSSSCYYNALLSREIRLVRLFPGDWSDKIHCQLQETRLPSKIHYKALSYAWGLAKATRPIFIDGFQHPVTVNLECALRRLRRPTEDLILWVDAICINQIDIEERGQQVDLMYEIFASAGEVIVYLGEVPHDHFMSSKSSEQQRAVLFHCDARDQEHLERSRAHALSRKPPNYALDVLCFLRILAGGQDLKHLLPFDSKTNKFLDSKYQRQLFEGLRQMLLARWWNRVWVIQEVVVPENVTVVYGSTTAPWEMFVGAAKVNAASFPHEYAKVLTHYSTSVLNIEGMRSLRRSGSQASLLDLLRRFRTRRASDDRDKVYGLLALVKSVTKIRPDYAKNVPEVYKSAVLDIIAASGFLDIFTGDMGRKDRQDLPTWVPDWSASFDGIDSIPIDSSYYSATNGSFVYVQENWERQWDGLSDYLGLVKSNSDGVPPPPAYFSTTNKILWSETWTQWLERNTKQYLTEPCLIRFAKFFKDSGTASGLQSLDDGIISLTGLQIDEIYCTGLTVLTDDMIWAEIIHCAELVTDYLDDFTPRHLFPYEMNDIDQAFRRTLCAGRLSLDCNANDKTSLFRHINNDDDLDVARCILNSGILSKQRSSKVWNLLVGILGDQPNSTVANMPARNVQIEKTIRASMAGRKFFITRQGYMGLGPRRTEKGDCIFVLLGGRTPFVLRNSGPRTIQKPWERPSKPTWRNTFEMVGDCYTDGIMNGEAMSKWKDIPDHPDHGQTQLLFSSESLRDMLGDMLRDPFGVKDDILDPEFRIKWKNLPDQSQTLPEISLQTLWYVNYRLSTKWRREEWDRIVWAKATDFNRLKAGTRRISFADFASLDLADWKAAILKLCGDQTLGERARFYAENGLNYWQSAFDEADNMKWLAELIKAGLEELKRREEICVLTSISLDENIQAISERGYQGEVYLV